MASTIPPAVSNDLPGVGPGNVGTGGIAGSARILVRAMSLSTGPALRESILRRRQCGRREYRDCTPEDLEIGRGLGGDLAVRIHRPWAWCSNLVCIAAHGTDLLPET